MKPKIIPYSLPEHDRIGIRKMSITYVQMDDTNHKSDEYDEQSITIETEDTICSEKEAIDGEGYYLVLKSDRWAFTDPEEIMELTNDFIKRLMITSNFVKEEQEC